MLNLNSEKYSSVHLRFKKITPWIVNEGEMDVLRENACFVRHSCLHKKAPTIYRDVFDLKIDDDETLKYLGMASMGILGSPFVGLAEHKRWDEQADTILLAERFHYPGCYHIGAGRHVLLKNIHLKGIGRNLLSINEDYSHAWGGLLIKDALKGYVTSKYVDHRTQLPSLKLQGLFMYEDKDSDGVPTVMAVRDAKSFRIAQAHPETLSVTEKQTIRQHLETFFKHTDPHLMLDTVIENYVHAYSVGVRHKSISPDNLLVDGRWIDTESLDINLTQESFDEWISFSLSQGEFDFSPDKFSSLEKNFSNDFVIHDSWIHQLRLMGHYTFVVYAGLFEKMNYDFEMRFAFFLKKYFSHLNLELWQRVLTNKNFSAQETDLAQLKLRGYFFDHKMQAHKLTFGAIEADSFDLMDKLTSRWEKAFWPLQKNWSSAFSLAAQIEKMCGAS